MDTVEDRLLDLEIVLVGRVDHPLNPTPEYLAALARLRERVATGGDLEYVPDRPNGEE